MNQQHRKVCLLGDFCAHAVLEKLDQQVLIVRDHGQHIGFHVGAKFRNGFRYLKVGFVLKVVSYAFEVFHHALLEILTVWQFILIDVQNDEF